MIRCRRALVAYHATHAQAKANIVPAGGASERDTHSALQPMPHYLANPARTYGPHHRSNTHTGLHATETEGGDGVFLGRPGRPRTATRDSALQLHATVVCGLRRTGARVTGVLCCCLCVRGGVAVLCICRRVRPRRSLTCARASPVSPRSRDRVLGPASSIGRFFYPGGGRRFPLVYICLFIPCSSVSFFGFLKRLCWRM